MKIAYGVTILAFLGCAFFLIYGGYDDVIESGSYLIENDADREKPSKYEEKHDVSVVNRVKHAGSDSSSERGGNKKRHTVRAAPRHVGEDIPVDLQGNYTLDENGDHVAVPFSPVMNGGVERLDEYGESLAAEIEPDQNAVINVGFGPSLEDSFISSEEGDFAKPMMLETTSGESEANPIISDFNDDEAQDIDGLNEPVAR